MTEPTNKRKKSISSRMAGYTAIFITVAILSLFVCFYLWHYVAANEEVINQRQFRTLERIALNINLRIPDYAKLAKQKVSEAKIKIEKENKQYTDFSDLLCSTLRDISNNKYDLIEYKRYDAKRDTNNERKNILLKGNIFIKEVNNETYIIFKNFIHVNNSDSGFVFMGMEVGRYLPKLLKHDFFSNFALIKDKRVIYNDFSQRIDVLKIDTLLDEISGFKAGSIRKASFSNQKFTLYTIPFSIFNQDIYTLTGAVPTQKITSEKFSVPANYLFALLFILLGIAIAFPFLKVFLMNPFEKLNTIDILLSVLSLTFGTGLFFYILFNQFQNWYVDNIGNDQLQKELSVSIKNSFINDLLLANKQLMAYDSLIPKINKDLINIRNVPAEVSGKKFVDTNQIKLLSRNYYPYFKLVSWLDIEGNDIYKWLNSDVFPANYNYSDRPYFKNIKEKATWNLPGQHNDVFTLQPIRSWTDGEFRAVFAKPSINKSLQAANGEMKSVMLTAISCRLPSVISPVLPYGYSFAIINPAGEVWFHSDKNRCLNENLIEECNQNDHLTASIYARSSGFFTEHYSGTTSNMYIQPIDGLPLFIVTIRNEAPMAVKNIKIFAITFLLFILFILAGGLQIGILILFNMRRSRLKANRMRLDWLWPDHRKEKVENYKRYCIINAGMLVLTLLFTCIVPVSQSPGMTFLLVIFNSFTTITLYFYISQLRYSSNHTGLQFYISGFLIVINLIALCVLDWPAIIITYVYQAATLFAVYAIFKDYFGRKKKIASSLMSLNDSESKNYDHVGWFSLMLLSWIMLMAFIPAYKFYVLAYNTETEVIARQHQLSWVKEINRYADYGTESSENYFEMLNKETDSIKNIYTETSNYTTHINNNHTKLNPIDIYPDSGRTFICGLNRFMRLVFNETSKREYVIGHFNEQDSVSYKWKKYDESNLMLETFDGINSRNGIGDSLSIVTTLPQYQLPGYGNSWFLIFWIILLSFIYLLFIVIRYFIRKLFLPDYFKSTPPEQLKFIEKLSETDLKSNESKEIKLFMVSLPHSGKNSYLRNTEKFAAFTKIFIDFALLRKPDEWAIEMKKLNGADINSLIICSHFEYYLSDKKINQDKLETIEWMLRKKFKNIILISNIHPAEFLNYMSETKTEGDELTTDIQQLFKDKTYYIWSHLLSSFEVVYYPLEFHIGPVYHENQTAAWFIYNECNHGLFLKNLMKNLSIYTGEVKSKLPYENLEDIVLKIQTLAYNYYLSLWNALSIEEQYVLYDLAEDGLVNYKNFEPLTQLHLKGLIINRGRPEVMNKSFRNFILTEVKKGSPVISNRERSKNSAWSQFKTPFYLILIVVLFFIFYTQQDSFNSLTTILGSLTATIPLILRLFSFIKEGKGEST